MALKDQTDVIQLWQPVTHNQRIVTQNIIYNSEKVKDEVWWCDAICLLYLGHALFDAYSTWGPPIDRQYFNKQVRP